MNSEQPATSPTIEELEQKLASDPDNLTLWLDLASELAVIGRADDAIALCREVVLREPERERARDMLEHLGGAFPTAEDTTPSATMPALDGDDDPDASDSVVFPPGVNRARRATLRGLFSKTSPITPVQLVTTSETELVEPLPRTGRTSDSVELLDAFDRTDGDSLAPRRRRPSFIETSLNVFPGMPDEAVEELVHNVNRRTFEAGDIILREGEPGDACFVLVSGSARVLKRDPLNPKGDLVDVSRLTAGQLFGEFAVLADRRRHATVLAEGQVVALEITRPLLARLSRKFPEMGPILESFYRERLIRNLVSTAPFLRIIDEDRRRALFSEFIPMRVGANEPIITQGERAGGFYLIVLGGVELTKEVDGETISIATLREGTYFGVLSLLRGDVARASVITTGETELAMLPPQSFYNLISELPILWEEVRREAHERELTMYQLVAGVTSSI